MPETQNNHLLVHPSPTRMTYIAANSIWCNPHSDYGEWIPNCLHLDSNSSNNYAELRAIDLAITTINTHLASVSRSPSLAGAPIAILTDSYYACMILDGNWRA